MKKEKELNYIDYLKDVIIKPFDKFKKEENKLKDIKNVGILGLIVVGILTFLKLISTMINVARVTSLFGGKTSWIFDNIKHINYFKTIFENFMIYALIIGAIAGIYYLASLVIKKEIDFSRVLAVAITSFIPIGITSSILATVMSIINLYLAIAVVIIGFIYSLLILIELMNDLVPIENNTTKIYFHLVSLSILFIVVMFIYKIIISSALNNITSILR